MGLVQWAGWMGLVQWAGPVGWLAGADPMRLAGRGCTGWG